MKNSRVIPFCAAVFVGLSLSAARADIVFEEGNNPLDDSNNVLHNDPALLHEGPLVQGNFNGQPGSGFVVEFTSTSGSGDLVGNGGQARLEGGEDNDPLEQVTFGLADGATFTGAVFNPFQGDGTATVTVTEDNGETSVFEYDLGNGQNFLTVTAINGQKIASISIEAPDGFTDLRQVRIAGFEGQSNGVPDGGLTLILLGFALPVLAAGRKYLGI